MITRPTKVILGIWALVVAAWMILPTLVIIPLSFTGQASLTFPPSSWSLRWYQHFFQTPEWTEPLLSTLKVALLTTLVATALGTLAALGLHRLSPRLAAPARTFFLAPMVVPGIVVAVGVYVLFLRLGFTGTVRGFVFAHTVLALPLVVINVATSLAGFDERMTQAAASLGARPVKVLFTVTLPLIMPGVIAGALFAFMTSFDEVIISLFIQSPTLQTMPVRMYASVTKDSDPTVAAAAVIVVTMTLLLLALAFAISQRARRTRD